MNKLRKLHVVDWQDSPRPAVPKKRARRRFFPPALIGMLGTLLLHAMLIQSVYFGSKGPNPKPPEARESANASSKFTAEADSLALISLPTIGNANQVTSESATASLANLSKMKIKPVVHVDSPELLEIETLALSEDQAMKSTIEGGDGAEQARLFGIYTGQIEARIARVWRRPRSPVNEDNASQNANDGGESFQCEAQIVQDLRGNVQEVMLPRCNGSSAWRNSLVLAIQHASPLPAPPSMKVFTQSISLHFVGLAYVSGSSDEDYEIEVRRSFARE
jgi:hypothetical protein